MAFVCVYFYILKKVRVLFKRTSIQLEGNNLRHYPKIKYIYIYIYINHFYMYNS